MHPEGLQAIDAARHSTTEFYLDTQMGSEVLKTTHNDSFRLDLLNTLNGVFSPFSQSEFLNAP